MGSGSADSAGFCSACEATLSSGADELSAAGSFGVDEACFWVFLSGCADLGLLLA
jgi:hypothetical protein